MSINPKTGSWLLVAAGAILLAAALPGLNLPMGIFRTDAARRWACGR
jgi:hypothetical protein